MSIFENLENLNVSEECFDDIMDIIESILEGREPFETQLDYKERLQKHFGPKLADKKSTQKSIAKHHGKLAKGLNKEVKKLRAERHEAGIKDKEAHQKWVDANDVANAVKDKHGRDSEIFKKVEDARNKVSNAQDKKLAELDKQLSALRGVEDTQYQMNKTGTYRYDNKDRNK